MRYRTRLASRQSKKFIERRKIRGIIIGALIIVSVVSGVYSASQLTYVNFLTIDKFDVVGADPDIAVKIEALAAESIQGQILGLFSKSNSFLYPAKSLTSAVLDSSPKIQSVSIYRKDLRTLAIVINEKQAVATVCPGLPDFSDNGFLADSSIKCYEADVTGYIFDQLSTTSNDRNLYFVQDLADASSTSLVGTMAATSSEFVGLQGFYNGARRAGLRIQAILVKDLGEYEMYVWNQAGDQSSDSQTTVVYFNSLRSLEDQLANLISFWNSAKGPFEYIDVRYGSNVFYRLMQ